MSELNVTRRPPARTVGAAFAVCCVLASTVFALGLPSAALAEACPNEAFRTGPSASLPDCRAYELVTPAYKEGYSVSVLRLAADGASVSANSLGTFAGVEGTTPFDINGDLTSIGSEYTLTRGASGWAPVPTALPQSQFTLSLLADYSPDLDSSLWLASTLSQAPSRPFNPYKVLSDFYVREPGGAIRDVGPLYPPSAEPELFGENDFEYDGASSDLSHMFFTMFNNHWPGDATPNGAVATYGHPSLYEYAGTGNAAPTLVGVSGGPGSASLISKCGTEAGPARPSQFAGESAGEARGRNSVSTAGATVFFTALECGSSPAVDELFARIDGSEADAHTVAISEPSHADCAACDTETGARAGATFQGASADGSKVFFTTSQPLLGGDASSNLYEYDFESPEGQRVTRVSGGDGTLPVAEAGVQSVPIVSNDGSHVYFIATGALTSTPNGQGQTAHAGAENLYLFERDSRYPAGRTAFIADLCASADLSGVEPDGQCPSSLTAGILSSGAKNDGNPSLSASLNGRFLVFLSYADLTPDDASNGAQQAFEYDAQTGDLVRVSIGQDGYNANGNNSIGLAFAPHPPVAISSPTNAVRGLSVADTGAVFFDSTASLVPQAVSGTSNVYEYENGNVYLISDGHDTSGANFLFVDPSGENVFFETHDQLVGQDGDTQADVYDARIDGGFPQPASPITCEGDACQGQLSAPPVLLSPGSESQAGGGNLPPTASPPAAVAKPKIKKPKPRRRRGKAKSKGAKAHTRRVARTHAKRGGRS